MKKYSFLLFLIALMDCDGEETNSKKIIGQLLLLQIDYNTHVFEGGSTLKYTYKAKNFCDSIPVDLFYDSPGPSGSLTYRYIPKKDTIFYGTVIWQGTGSRIVPNNLIPAQEFGIVSPVSAPPNSTYQLWLNNFNEFDYSEIFNSVANLQLVQNYLNQNTKVGLFLYRASEGAGNPQNWDWYLLFYLETEE
jgi:hypothetical protein